MPKTKKGKYQNRDIYLNAALDIIKEEGVEKLTMRHLADKLDVSAMAVYKHFANKNELLKALLDAFIARADVLPDHELPWQGWVHHVATKMHEALQGETVFLTILGTMDVGERAMEVTQAFLKRLCGAGFSTQQAIEAYMAMIQLVLGSAFLQRAVEQHQHKAMEVVSTDITKATARKMVSRPQIDIGLEYLIAGMYAKLRADTALP